MYGIKKYFHKNNFFSFYLFSRILISFFCKKNFLILSVFFSEFFLCFILLWFWNNRTLFFFFRNITHCFFFLLNFCQYSLASDQKVKKSSVSNYHPHHLIVREAYLFRPPNHLCLLCLHYIQSVLWLYRGACLSSLNAIKNSILRKKINQN